jgi:predicted ATPase
LRDNKAADFLRRARKRSRDLVLTSVVYENVAGLGSGRIDLSGFMTCIAGANAAGKSTLVQVLRVAADPRFLEEEHYERRRLAGARIEGVFMSGRDEMVRRISIREDGHVTVIQPEIPHLDVQYMNLASESRDIMGWARSTNLDQQLEAISPQIAKPKDLDRVSRLVRKRYAEVQTFELELHDRPVFPYFRVREDWPGAPMYGCESMGQGEMALHLLDWYLRRIDVPTLLLVEEPEAHVFDGSHKAILDSFAWVGSNHGCSVVLSTHSWRVVSLVEPEAVRIATRHQDGVRIIADPQLQAAKHALHMPFLINGIVAVEDSSASMLTRIFLRALGSDAASSVEFVVVGDASAVTAAAAKTPRTENWLRVIGVLDGDQRKEGLPRRLNWPLVFMPGTTSPERWLSDIIINNIESFGSKIALTTQKLEVILSSISGLEPHDWIVELSARTGYSHQDLYSRAVEVFIADSGNRSLAENFVRAIEEGLQVGVTLDAIDDSIARLVHEGSKAEILEVATRLTSLTDDLILPEDWAMRLAASISQLADDATGLPGTSSTQTVDADAAE